MIIRAAANSWNPPMKTSSGVRAESAAITLPNTTPAITQGAARRTTASEALPRL
jgi:hypothetical protein